MRQHILFLTSNKRFWMFIALTLVSFTCIPFFYNVYMLEKQVVLFKHIANNNLESAFSSLLTFTISFFVMQGFHFLAGIFASKALPVLYEELQSFSFQKMQKLPLQVVENQDGPTIEKMSSGFAENITLFLENILMSWFPLVCDILFFTFMVFRQSSACGSLVLIWTGSCFAIVRYATRNMKSKELDKEHAVEKSFFSDVFHNSLVSKVLFLGDYNSRLMRGYTEKSKNTYEKCIALIGKTRFLFGLFNISFFFGLSVLVMKRNFLSPALLINVFWQLTRKMWDLLSMSASFNTSYGRAKNSMDFFCLKEENLQGGLSISKIHSISVKELNLRVNNNLLLSSLNLVINAGDFVVLRGPSGVGKSLLLKTLAGLSNVDPSSVFINEHDIKTLSKDSIMKNITYLPQGDLMYNTTVRDNMKLGIEEEERLVELCDLVNFPLDLLDRICGVDAAFLSGGQKRKISIIRALLHKKNTRTIFLDEPFTALDHNNIQCIKNLLETLRGTYTIVCIDHTEFLLPMADKVFTLDSAMIGEIVSAPSRQAREAA